MMENLPFWENWQLVKVFSKLVQKPIRKVTQILLKCTVNTPSTDTCHVPYDPLQVEADTESKCSEWTL